MGDNFDGNRDKDNKPINKASKAVILVPWDRLTQYFVKMLKMAKLTVLLVEDDIAKVILSVPVENQKKLGTYIHTCHQCWETQRSGGPNKSKN